MQKSQNSFYAIFIDIHANIDAFSAVLADTDQFPVRGMFCLGDIVGDIVGYSPEPGSCIQCVIDTCAITVLGNHEAMLFLAEEILDEDWDITVGKPILLARDQLSKKQSDCLHSHTLTAVADPLALSHASLSDPANFHCIHTPEEASAHFKAQTTFISFNGHTHVPEIWEQDAASGSLTTSQLGSSTITRDSKGNTWTTTKVGNSFVTRGPGGQQQTTSKLGNSFVTRDSKTGSTLTTSPVGNSFQTRGNSGASWSTSHLGSSLVTRGSSSSAKKDEKATQVIVIPSSK
jgi:predicted phosphodiesterase